jgi:hypothetical protein
METLLMDETKPWYQSKTIWASVVTVLLGLLLAFKVTHLGSVQTDLVQQNSDSLADLLAEIGVLLSGLVAFVGRVTAKTTLTGTKAPADGR